MYTSRKNAIGKIANREEFQGNTLCGRKVTSAAPNPYGLGRMDGDAKALWFADVVSEQITYVVFSYATPIAWHRKDTGWTIPSTKYSKTTSTHQHIVRMAVR